MSTSSSSSFSSDPSLNIAGLTSSFIFGLALSVPTVQFSRSDHGLSFNPRMKRGYSLQDPLRLHFHLNNYYQSLYIEYIKLRFNLQGVPVNMDVK